MHHFIVFHFIVFHFIEYFIVSWKKGVPFLDDSSTYYSRGSNIVGATEASHNLPKATDTSNHLVECVRSLVLLLLLLVIHQRLPSQPYRSLLRVDVREMPLRRAWSAGILRTPASASDDGYSCRISFLLKAMFANKQRTYYFVR